jgi:hemerythrin superfamily protein
MNAIELLKEDHNEMRGLFGKYKASDSDTEKHNLFKKVKEMLDAHTHIEETIFYPKIKEQEELEDITLEGIEEHHVADVLAREISALADESEKFDPKMDVLIEGVEHHMQEEEGEMFPKVEEIFNETELQELGKQMQEEEKKFKKSHTASA